MGTKSIYVNPYGSGGRTPNPAWEQWNNQVATLRDAIRMMPAALQQNAQGQLDALIAQEPQQWLETELGATNRMTNEMGDAAAADIRARRDDIYQVGQDAYDSGNQAAAAAGAQATAAQDRGAPQLDVQGRARDAQSGAANAAIAFQAPTQGGQAVADAARHYGSGVWDVASANANVIGSTRANDSGAAGIRGAGEAGAQNLSDFRAATSGINALNKFAQGPAGPSAAEAMLRMQAARDKATALSRARSVRGGPGAVAEAMKVAQAEGAAISADTRGQAALTRATEAAAARQQSLQALSAAGGLQQQASATNLQAQTAGAQLGLQGQTAATQAELEASRQNLQAVTTAGQLATEGAVNQANIITQGLTNAGQLDLGASGQNLQAIQVRADIASSIRAMDIDQAKAQLSAELQSLALNDEQTRFFAGLAEQARQDANAARAQATQAGMSADVAAANVALQYATQAWQMLTTDQQLELQRAGLEAGVVLQNNANQAAERQQILGFIGSALMAGGMAMPKSDRRAKHDVRRLRSMAAALRSTPGSSYRYKDPKDGKGVFAGPMAQDLEKTREFRNAVVEVGGVKRVDTGRLTLAHHAALSDLQRQIDRLEKLGRKGGTASDRGDAKARPATSRDPLAGLRHQIDRLEKLGRRKVEAA
jgi:hypothetical protein